MEDAALARMSARRSDGVRSTSLRNGLRPAERSRGCASGTADPWGSRFGAILLLRLLCIEPWLQCFVWLHLWHRRRLGGMRCVLRDSVHDFWRMCPVFPCLPTIWDWERMWVWDRACV